MEKKKRMKSTFANKVRIGTLWKCILADTIILDHTIAYVPPNDMLIVIGKEKTIFPNSIVVNLYSQKLKCEISTPLDELYSNYELIN